MSGSLIGGIIGGAIGIFAGNPALGWTIGSAIGGALDPGKLPDQFGPRLQDLRPQTSEYGRPIPIVYGKVGLGGNVIWASDLVEVATTTQQGGKGGGPSQSTTTYTYYANFAVAICEGTATVTRIWAGPEKRLIYDRVNVEGGAVRVYTGSETQLPDPLIESYLGVGNVPAYRGTCYVVFEGFPVAKDGNRIPFVTVEVASDAIISTIYPVTSFLLGGDPGQSVGSMVINKEGTLAYIGMYNYRANIYIVNLASEQVVGLIPGAGYFSLDLLISPDGRYLYSLTPIGVGGITVTDISSNVVVTTIPVTNGRAMCMDLTGTFMYIAKDNTSTLSVIDLRTNTASGTIPVSTVSGQYSQIAINPADGVRVGITLPPSAGGAGRVYFVNVVTGALLATVMVGSSPVGIVFNAAGTFAYIANYGDGTMSVINLSTYTVVATVNCGGAGAQSRAIVLSPDGTRGYVGGAGSITVVDLTTNTVLATVVSSYAGDSLTISPNGLAVYIPVDGPANFAPNTVYVLRTAPNVVVNSVPLSTVVADLSNRAGLTSGQRNVAALTDIVDGYVIARQTTVRSAIDALRPAYYFDAVESLGVVKYVKRGGAIAATIPDADLGAHDGSGQGPDPLFTTRRMEVELPRSLNVNYLLAATNYSPATKLSKRLIGSSQEVTKLDLPLVLSDAKAQQIADVNLHGAWVQRLSYSFSLPRKYSDIEPTDIVVVKGFTMRVTKIAATPSGVLKCEAVADDANFYVPNSVVTATPTSGNVVAVQGPTRLELM